MARKHAKKAAHKACRFGKNKRTGACLKHKRRKSRR